MNDNVQGIKAAGASQSDRALTGVAIALFAILGAGLVIWATKWGAGISLDSTRYLSAATDLKTSLGGDSVHRLVHYPPLFPIALSIGRLFGARPMDWSRWMHAGLLVLNIALAGRLLLRVMDRRSSLWIVILGAAMLAVCRDSLRAYSSIWSEPLYITFLLGAILWLHRYLASERYPVRDVIFAAICVALACLTRYAGASLVAAGMLSIVLLNPTSRRWLHTLLFAAISSALPVLWSLYNHFTVGRATGRSIGFHPPTFEFHGRGLLNTFLNWWIPATAPLWMQIVVVISAVAVLAAAITLLVQSKPEAQAAARSDPSAAVLLKMLLVFAVLYPCFLMVTISTVDIRTPLDDRILLPEFVVGLLINLILLKWFWQWAGSMLLLRVATAIFCLSLVGIYATSSVIWAAKYSEDGLGWARKRYVDPELVALLKKTIPSTAVIYTNEPSPLLAENFKGVIDPLPTFSGDPKKDTDFRLGMREVRTQIEDGQAWIIFFSHRAKASEIEHDELRKALPLSVKGRGDKWIVYARNRRLVNEMNAAQRAARRSSTTSSSQPAEVDDSPDEPADGQN